MHMQMSGKTANKKGEKQADQTAEPVLRLF